MASTSSQNDFKSYMKKLDDTFDLYLRQKAPALPTNAKEAIVRFSPWIVLILLIIALPPILGLLGLSAVLSPFMGLHGGLGNIVSIIILIAALAFEAMAIPGLFKRAAQGWRYAYYSSLLSGLSALVNLDIVGALLGTLISMYILYQVKEYYK